MIKHYQFVGQTLSVGHFSEVGIKVGDCIVIEVSDERTGDKDGSMHQSSRHDCYDEAQHMYRYNR